MIGRYLLASVFLMNLNDRLVSLCNISLKGFGMLKTTQSNSKYMQYIKYIYSKCVNSVYQYIYWKTFEFNNDITNNCFPIYLMMDINKLWKNKKQVPKTSNLKSVWCLGTCLMSWDLFCYSFQIIMLCIHSKSTDFAHIKTV